MLGPIRNYEGHIQMGRGRKTRHFLGSNFLRAITVRGINATILPRFFCLCSEEGHERKTPSKIIQDPEDNKFKSKAS